MNQHRAPAGGQFEAGSRAESDVALTGHASVGQGDIEAARAASLAAFEGEGEVRRFSCEHHDTPGSCTPECVDLVAAMSEGPGEEFVDSDPDGVRRGPTRPYDTYEYDVEQRASLRVTHVPEGKALPETLLPDQRVRLDGEDLRVDTVSVGRFDVHLGFAPGTRPAVRKFRRDQVLDLVHPDDIQGR